MPMSNPARPMWPDHHDEPNAPISPPSASRPLLILRLIALVGVAIVLCWDASSLWSMEPRQDWGSTVLVLAVPAVAFACVVLMPRATSKLSRHLDLLLPLGLYITAVELLGFLTTLPVLASVLAPSWSFKILSLSFTLSVAFLLQIALAVTYGGWTTALILQAVKEGRLDPTVALARIGKWFWRVLGAEIIGWGVLFLGLAVGLTVGIAVLPVALISLGVFFLVWNLMTAALLPVVVAEQAPFGTAIKQGIRISWTGKGRWWLAVVAQMALLGCVTFVSVSYSSHSPSILQGSGNSDVDRVVSNMFNRHEKTHFGVNGFWTGGYEDECRWYSDLMKVAEAKKLPLVETLLGLMFGILAIIVKIKVATEVYGNQKNGVAIDGGSEHIDSQPT